MPGGCSAAPLPRGSGSRQIGIVDLTPQTYLDDPEATPRDRLAPNHSRNIRDTVSRPYPGLENAHLHRTQNLRETHEERQCEQTPRPQDDANEQSRSTRRASRPDSCCTPPRRSGGGEYIGEMRRFFHRPRVRIVESLNPRTAAVDAAPMRRRRRKRWKRRRRRRGPRRIYKGKLLDRED